MNKINFLYDYAFPNYYLPNATPLDLMIINYLHAQHTVTDETFGITHQDAVVGKLFSHKKHMWPQSSDSSNLFHPCFAKQIQCNFDIVKNNQDYEKYVYLIKMSPHVDEFVGVQTLRNKPKILGDYFYKNISERAIQDIRSGKAILVLDYCLENWVHKHEFDQLHSVLSCINFPSENVLLLINSLNAQELYESWYTPEQRKLRVGNLPFLMYASSHHYGTNWRNSVNSVHLEKRSVAQGHRPYYYLCKAKQPRLQRQTVLLHLAASNLLEKGNWSYLNDSLPVDLCRTVQKEFEIEYDKKHITELNAQLPKTLNSEEDETADTISAWTDKDLNIYADSYFYICTETYFGHERDHRNNDHKILTEKIFKPIANLMPFIFVSFPGALTALRELGFKTFDGHINESYDLETDPKKRMQMILAEIDRLCSFTKQEIHDWYWAQWDICLHNQAHLFNIHTDMTYIKHIWEFLGEPENEL